MIRRVGMGGLGDSEVMTALNRITGGAATKVAGKLDQVERALKITVVASLVAAAAAVAAVYVSTRRR